MSKYPKDRKYSKEDSWVKVDGEIAIIGIIESTAKEVEEFGFINLPEKGKILNKGDDYVSLEAVKWSGHMSSPLSGEIIEVNDSLFEDPSKINKDPYNNWIIKIKIKNNDEINELIDSDDVKEYYQNK